MPLWPPATGIDGCSFPAGKSPILGRVPGLFLHPFHIPMGRTLENKQQIVEELKQLLGAVSYTHLTLPTNREV